MGGQLRCKFAIRMHTTTCDGTSRHLRTSAGVCIASRTSSNVPPFWKAAESHIRASATRKHSWPGTTMLHRRTSGHTLPPSISCLQRLPRHPGTESKATLNACVLISGPVWRCSNGRGGQRVIEEFSSTWPRRFRMFDSDSELPCLRVRQVLKKKMWATSSETWSRDGIAAWMWLTGGHQVRRGLPSA